MGRHESLTAWALGRGAYEREVIQTETTGNGNTTQQYNDRGHPRNPNSKRRDRALIHAANEVMQVTGLVEDARAARASEKAFNEERLEDTFTGLRYMEVGRPLLVAGTWGVIGLRRRILICIDSIFEELRVENGNRLSLWEVRAKKLLSATFYYMTLHLRLFSILQQLDLVPHSRIFPSFQSFIPLTEASPIHFPSQPVFMHGSIAPWTLELIRVASPMLIIWSVGRIKHFISRLLYRPIYKSLPRPVGDSMFSGTESLANVYDSSTDVAHIEDSDSAVENNSMGARTSRRPDFEDELTLRALEGDQIAGQESSGSRRMEPAERLPNHVEIEDTGSEEGGDAPAVATLISFDVEATEQVDLSRGHWSAELRSAHEPKPSNIVTYRVTGMTLLPTILATEVLREIVAGILLMPLEAVMVRVIGRAYQQSAGVGISNLYQVNDLWSLIPAAQNLFGAVALQVVFAGTCWAGYTYAAQKYEKKKKSLLEEASRNSQIDSSIQD